MLLKIREFSQIDTRKFLDIYAESNRENAEDFFPGEDIGAAVKKVETGFIEFLDEFFSKPGNTYWILEEDGLWVSALRLSLIGPGSYYLEALETRPDSRQKGFAVKLMKAVTDELKAFGPFVIRDCVSKRNVPSIKTHEKAGFCIVSDAGRDYLSGDENDREYGFEYSHNE